HVMRDSSRRQHDAEDIYVVVNEVVDRALRVLRVHALRAYPGRRELRGVLLVEGLAGDPVGIACEHEGPIPEIGKEKRRDPFVIGDQVSLRVTVGGPEHLLEIGQPHLLCHALPSYRRRGSGGGGNLLRSVVTGWRRGLLAPAVLGGAVAPQAG